MAATQQDFSLDDFDIPDEDKRQAHEEALKILSERALFPEWVKDPPEWFVAMYLLSPELYAVRHRIAFERIQSRPGLYKAIIPLLFTHMLIVGKVDDFVGYDDRWCYADFPSALDAFRAWDGACDTEPDGWHRHPRTGRRREQRGDGTWEEHQNW